MNAVEYEQLRVAVRLERESTQRYIEALKSQVAAYKRMLRTLSVCYFISVVIFTTPLAWGLIRACWHAP